LGWSPSVGQGFGGKVDVSDVPTAEATKATFATESNAAGAIALVATLSDTLAMIAALLAVGTRGFGQFPEWNGLFIIGGEGDIGRLQVALSIMFQSPE